MKAHQQKLFDMINSASDYQMVSSIVSSMLDVIVAENKEVNTSIIDCWLYDENQNRHLQSTDTLRARRSRHIITNCIKSLTLASAREQVARYGYFQIPGCGDNDYIFEDDIIEKYEVFDDGNLKDEYDKYATFDVAFSGELYKIFERHSCLGVEIVVYFGAELGFDFMKLTKLSDVDYYFMKVVVQSDGEASVDNLVSLADELAANRNKLVLINEIKYGETKSA